jgi:HEAT repeat protein
MSSESWIEHLLAQAQNALLGGHWPQLADLLEQGLLVEAGESSITPNPAQQHQLLTYAIATLEAGDFQTQWDIAKVFPYFGEHAIAPLAEILHDPDLDPELCWSIVRILGMLKHPTAVPVLIQCWQAHSSESDDADINAAVVEAFINLGGVAIAPLGELLTNPNHRLFVVRALAHIRGLEAINPLLRVIKDEDATIRATAIEALSYFQDARIIPVLMSALDDPAAVVRCAAVNGLSLRIPLARQLDLQNLFTQRLWDWHPQVCQQAALALSRLGGPQAVTALIKRLRSSQTPLDLQLSTVQALGWIGSLA